VPALVAFDCDGTLVDGQHMIVAAMRGAFAAHGLGAPADEQVRRVVGLSLAEAVGRLMPADPVERHFAVAESYKAAFFELRTADRTDEPLFPGIRAALERIAADGALLAVCTGKSRRGLHGVLERHGLKALFASLQTADTHPGKPHPSMLRAAMAEAGAEAHETVLIGDTSYDMQMARSAGTAALGVAWGYHPVEELREAGAQAIVGHAAELPGAVRRLLRPAAAGGVA